MKSELVFKRVKIRTKSGLEIEGVVLPRYTMFSDDYITLKLDNGYNIGISKDNIDLLVEIETKQQKEVIIYRLEEMVEARPISKLIRIISTGGTIASKVDYETGGVTPILSVDELMDVIPELREIARFEIESPMSIFSEEMTPKHWEIIADIVYSRLSSDPDTGIIIAHGTDTMAYTSAALSFALKNLPSPIAFVGSQRSSDRPSSDSAFNLISASIYASSQIGEIGLVLHGTISDTYALAHRGTRVRKMHTSRRDAFQSIDSLPLAKIFPYENKIQLLRDDVKTTVKGLLEFKGKFSEKVALIKFYPGMNGDFIDFLIDRGYRGIVLEGTGLGHVSLRLLDAIERGIQEGVIITMTSQCIFGTVNMNVYSTGRKLLEKGVIPSGDMLPETAYVKLSWLLGNYDDPSIIRRLYVSNLAGELEERRTISLYPRWPHDA